MEVRVTQWNRMGLSILLYRCTIWMQIKYIKKKLDKNYTKILRAILNKSWKQRSIKQQLYSHLPLISQTIQARRLQHDGYCWWSNDELISNIFSWICTWMCQWWPTCKDLHQLFVNVRCSLHDLLGVMDYRDGWWERVRGFCAVNSTWWWWSMLISSK